MPPPQKSPFADAGNSACILVVLHHSRPNGKELCRFLPVVASVNELLPFYGIRYAFAVLLRLMMIDCHWLLSRRRPFVQVPFSQNRLNLMLTLVSFLKSIS